MTSTANETGPLHLTFMPIDPTMRCRTYWGTHACMNDRGHDPVELPHRCMCCTHDTHTGFTDCVGGPPYYGPTTMFWGEDAPGANQ